jgi:signal transduction histidine kinase
VTPDFKILFDSAPGSYLALTPDLVIVAATDAYLVSTKTRREDILGRSIFEIYPGDSAQPGADFTRNLRNSIGRVTRRKKQDLMPAQKVQITQLPFGSGRLEERYWYSVNTPVLNTEGEIQYIIHQLEDVTYKRLERTNVELEHIIEERTRQLQDTIRELESFSYSVSHDLKAPLRAIDGFSRILIEEYGDKLDEDGRRVLQVIRTSTLKMGLLIENLLDLARLGRKQMQITDIDMNAMVSGIFNDIRASAPDRQVELKCGLLHRVKADPVLMQQILTNLLSNAFKFTRSRNPAIVEVGSRVREAEHDVLFWVRDNGVGFDMKYSNKLFGVFQRLHTDREFDGTGIGLAIVQRAVHRHSGHVWAESEPDRGATFYFSLPLNSASEFQSHPHEEGVIS